MSRWWVMILTMSSIFPLMMIKTGYRISCEDPLAPPGCKGCAVSAACRGFKGGKGRKVYKVTPAHKASRGYKVHKVHKAHKGPPASKEHRALVYRARS